MQRVHKAKHLRSSLFLSMLSFIISYTPSPLLKLFLLWVDVIGYWRRQWLSMMFNSPRRQLKNRLVTAFSPEEYHDIAMELDDMLQNDTWKDNLITNKYDYRLIQERLRDLKNARLSNDTLRLFSLLRAGMLRNFGGISNKSLFNRTYTGTKTLIEQYVSEVILCLDWIDNIDDEQLKLNFFHDAKTTMGTTALCLHGGSIFGLCHVGVVKALFETGLLPQVIAGSGIGAVVGALVGCLTDQELRDILSDLKMAMAEEGYTVNQSTMELVSNNSSVSGASKENVNEASKTINQPISNELPIDLGLDLVWLDDLRRGLSPSLKLFVAFVLHKVGDLTFYEANRHSGKTLNVLVYPTNPKVPNLLNYLSTPYVTVRSAICCSMGGEVIKGLESISNDLNKSESISEQLKMTLEVKYQNELFKFTELECQFNPPYESGGADASDVAGYTIQGSRSPYTRMSEMFNVNHFVISISRPYLAPIILWDWKVQSQTMNYYDKTSSSSPFTLLAIITSLCRMVQSVTSLGWNVIIMELKHRLRMFQRLGWGFGKLGEILKWIIVDEKESLLETNHVPLVPSGERWWALDLLKIIEDTGFMNEFHKERQNSAGTLNSLNINQEEQEISTLQYWIQCGERSVWSMKTLLIVRCAIEFRLQEYFSSQGSQGN